MIPERLRVVIDTNVLVSGLIKPSGAPGRIVDLLLNGDFDIVVDDRILLEYQNVFSRRKFGFAPTDIQHLLMFIRNTAVTATAQPLKVELPDPKDQPFLEVARAASADAIVTGNIKHFPDVREAVVPAEFLQRFTR